MADEAQSKTPEEIALAREEMALRKYEAQLGVRKVIYGTMIVGLAGVLIPAAIEGWGLVFQKWQNEAQLRFEEQSRQEEFLTTHFETAIDESLDLRLRFAEYYAYTFDGYKPERVAENEPEYEKGKWAYYYEELRNQRKHIQKDILVKEREIRKLLAKSDDLTEQEWLELEELKIELDWLYDEIEYAEPGREVKPRSLVLSNASETPKPGTVSHYKSVLGPDAYGPDTSRLIPNQALLISVLGEPGDQIKSCLETIELPFELKLEWDLRKPVRRIGVHRAVAENFREAFEAIDSSNLDVESELRYAGAYAHRRRRGSPMWSRHAFGAEIDFNARTNALRMGQDQMTMHPEIVTAFKNAGFAWLGDLGRDGMSFVISTGTLVGIAESGFDPEKDCNGE